MKYSKALTSASANRSGFAARLKASRGRAIVAVVALLASMLSGAVLSPASAAVSSGITVNFEPGDTSGWSVLPFEGATGGDTTTVPGGVGAPSGTRSATVTKPVGAQPWAGATFVPSVANASNLLSAGNKTVSMKVYAPAAGKVVHLKLEADPAHTSEVDAAQVTTVGWQTLTFNFSAADPSLYQYKLAAVFFDFLSAANGDTYYFDDINFPGAVDLGITVNFEPGDTSGWSVLPFEGATGGDTTTVPGGVGAPSGTRSATVTKPVGAQPWAGATFVPSVANASNLLSAGNKTVSMKVYAPAAGKVVHLKLEADPAHTSEVDAAQVTTVGWQTLTFNFSAADPSLYQYKLAAVFFDFLSAANGDTYYFDDINFPGAVPPVVAPVVPPTILVNFEASDTSSYTLGGSADFEGAASSLSLTPPSGGSAGSVRAAKVVRPGNDGPWAGTTFLDTSTARVLANETHTLVTANVFSSVEGRRVALKLETHGDPTRSIETYATALTTYGWQTMTFNLAVQRPGTAAFNASYLYNKASIFFDFGTSFLFQYGAGPAETFYFDDVAFMGAVTPAPVREAPFTVTSATSATGVYTANVAATQLPGAYNYVRVLAPGAGYTGTIDATHWAYLSISNGTFWAGNAQNVALNASSTRADIVAPGATAVNVWVPDTKTATVKLISAVAVNGVVTETTLQTITITGVPAAAAAVASNGIVSSTKSWTLLRSHWTGWDPAQKTDDKVILGTSGSDSPAYIEGHLYDTIGETMTGMSVTIATTGPIVVGANKYEAPYSSLTGGVNTNRATTTSAIAGSNAFTVLVSADGSGRGGAGTITISVNGTVIGTKTVTVTGPVTGIKGVVNIPVISAGAPTGFAVPAKPAAMYTSIGANAYATAISFVAADANGSVSFDAYETMSATTSDTSVATAQLAADSYGNRFVALTGLKPGKVDVSVINAAGKSFFVGSVTVVSPVIASLVATPAKASVLAGESSTVNMVAKNADGVAVPDGTYTISGGNWTGSQMVYPAVNGVFTFVDGAASFKVYAPNLAGPFLMDLPLNSNAVLAPALQGKSLSVTLTITTSATGTATAITALSTAVQSLLAQVAAMSASFSTTFKLLTSRIKAAYAALAKLKAQAKR